MAGRRCPSCGASSLPEESRYCLHCGADLASGGAARPAARSYTPSHLERQVLGSRSAREGERKDVSVLMLDVQGSLRMAQQLDPEDLHAIMDAFFSLALEAVHAEGGVINQFRGDGFMALFGAPRALPDHPSGVLRAALRLRTCAREHSERVRARYGVPFVVRMGIHSGRVWVGAIGTDLRRDYTAEGPTVGLTARLEEDAAPGEILVSAETARRAGPGFRLRRGGVRRYRGVSTPVEVFELLGGASDPERLPDAPSPLAPSLTPFVGRERELAELARSLAGPRGGAAAVAIVGEPGIGKSRLATEYRRRFASRAPWLCGRARATARSRAFAPWIDALLHLVAEPSEREAAARLARAMGGEKGSLEPSQLSEGLASLAAALAREGPLHLLFEDAQWMDHASRELLGNLLRHPPDPGLRILFTQRPAEGEELALGVPTARLELGRLAPAEAQALARAVLGELAADEALVAFATQRGAGNPLFVEEVARALRDGPEEQRVTARLEMSWRFAGSRVPETLEGVLAARIDSLPDPAKRVLQAASVLEGPFDAALLAELDPELACEAARRLDQLVEHGLLLRGADGYEFRHVLTREVAYHQLVRARRRELHARAAEALGRRPLAATAPGASEIGAHWERAGAQERALPFLVRAGKAYLAALAPHEAALHLRRAWEILRWGGAWEAAQVADVGLALASALNILDHASEAAALLEALGTLAERTPLPGEDAVRLAEACIATGWVCFSEHGELARARTLLERGAELARTASGGERTWVTAHAHLVRLHHLDGRIPEAARAARLVAERAAAAGDRFGVVFGRGNEGYVRCDRGEVTEARRLTEEARRLAHDSEQTVAIALAEAWASKALVYAGDPEAALRAAERARVAAQRAGQRGALYNAENWSGEALLLLDEPRRADQAFERMAAVHARWPSTDLFRARGRLELGRSEEAAELARRCLARDPPLLIRARALTVLGQALGYGREEDGEAAEALLTEAASLCDRLGLRPHLAEAYLALAELCARRGEDERLRYFSERSVRIWEECGMPLHAGRARKHLAGFAS